MSHKNKVYIRGEEWWPVAVVRNYGAQAHELVKLTSEELSDLRRVQAEFNEWQRKLGEMVGTEFSRSFDLIYFDPED